MASRMSWVIKEGRFTPYLPWMAVTILDRDRSKQSTPDRDLITPRSWWNVDCFPWNRTKENQRRRFKVKEATPGVVLPRSPGAWCSIELLKNWSTFGLHPILTEAPSSELAGCKTSGKAAWKRQNTKINIKSLARLDLRAIGIFPFWVVLSFFNPIWRLLSLFLSSRSLTRRCWNFSWAYFFSAANWGTDVEQKEMWSQLHFWNINWMGALVQNNL